MRSIFWALIIICFSDAAAADLDCDRFSRATRISAGAMSHEIMTANGSNRAAAYSDYIDLFDKKSRIHGLVPNETAGIADVKRHYRAVFFELGGGVLIEDNRIVAGEMAAHRYHSMTMLNGVFDGIEAKNKPVVLRGQTFFRYDADGRIIERWSNHDHAYRMGQLLGETGREEGVKLAAALNGPGLTEEEGYQFVDRFVATFSMAEAPQERENAVGDLFDENLVLHGLGCSPTKKETMMAHLKQLWASSPDLFMTLADRPISGWSMVAFKWRSNGSLRAPYEGVGAETGSTVAWNGELIARLNEGGKAVEIWLNAEPLVGVKD